MALLEKSLLSKDLAWSVHLPADIRADLFLFSESQSRAVISCGQGSLEQIMTLSGSMGVPCRLIGEVVPRTLSLYSQGRSLIQMEVAKVRTVWSGALENVFRS
jgi:phosphoribosylformylglycinamidine synthase